MLAGVEDVKPDRMIQRFISRAVDRDVSEPVEARAILVAAHGLLVAEASGLTLRALDHTIWIHQRRQL